MSVRPKKELGQHFLVDENILGVIGRLADLRAQDAVLEIGPGLGILTAYLADRVARVHAIEVDRSLEALLTERLAGRPNVDLHFGDALAVDLARIAPDADKLVSNLPTVGSWCVMVQREVADRFFAQPRTKGYGAASVLVQLVTERSGFHAVSREVFRPRPNVDSALVAFRRREKAVPPGVKPVVEAAFAHRRKTLANSLALSSLATRERAVAALESIGRDANLRAEALAPQEFVALTAALA